MMNPSNIIRSFIAFEIKEPETIENIISYGNRLKNNQPNLKLVKPENIHMTVKFLGNIHESTAPKIYTILQEEINKKIFQGKVFEYKLKGAGQFRNHSVLWMKLNGNLQFLQDIKDKVETILSQKLKIQKDKRTKFQPHVTIGRLKSNKVNYKNFDVFKKLIKESKNLEFGNCKIDQIKFKKSVLTPKGPIYSDLVY